MRPVTSGWLRNPAGWMLLLLLCGMQMAVAAPPITVRQAETLLLEGQLVVNAQIDIPGQVALDDALQTGVTLSYRTDVEIFRPRWYWFDTELVRASREVQLSYQGLTRQYRVTRGTLIQHFPTLKEALAHAGMVRGWVVGERQRLKSGVGYTGRIRVRLDVSQLPTPFVVANRDIAQSSDWQPLPLPNFQEATGAVHD